MCANALSLIGMKILFLVQMCIIFVSCLEFHLQPKRLQKEEKGHNANCIELWDDQTLLSKDFWPIGHTEEIRVPWELLSASKG